MAQKTVITGTGSYIPTQIVTNKEFSEHRFYAEDGNPIETAPAEVVEKFRQITGIAERRYAGDREAGAGGRAAHRGVDRSGASPTGELTRQSGQRAGGGRPGRGTPR